MYKIGEKMENFIRVIKTLKRQQAEIVVKLVSTVEGLNG